MHQLDTLVREAKLSLELFTFGAQNILCQKRGGILISHGGCLFVTWNGLTASTQCNITAKIDRDQSLYNACYVNFDESQRLLKVCWYLYSVVYMTLLVTLVLVPVSAQEFTSPMHLEPRNPHVLKDLCS